MRVQKMFDTVLFDLDGTLADPGIGITNSVMYSLKKYGIVVSDRSELYKFIGPPLYESYEKYYGFSHAKATRAVEFYREYYRDKGIFENKLYEGTEELLQRICGSGKRAVLATSKPEVFAKQILEHFGLTKYFTFIAGATLDGSLLDKGDVIAYALKNLDNIDKTRTVMVGDRMHDIIGAKQNGLRSIGALYGYGSRAELEDAGADFFADSPLEILKML